MPLTVNIANLPDWAETRFQLACDEAGVVRNKAFHDRSGWDYLVEFERPRRPGLAHDLQPGPATARVQVKSKRAGNARCEVKLSNALRFCREPDPCFVVMYRISRDGQRVEVFAREFDEELMAAALRRARQADRDGVDDLNRIRLPIAFASEHERDDDLLDWLRARAAVDGADYSSRKAGLNRSLGRETFATKGTVTFAWDDLQAFIEHGVGIGPPVDVAVVRLEDVRFGIPARNPIVDGRPDFFSIQVQPRRASLIFQGEDGREAVFEGEIRSFNLPGLPSSRQRTRFTSACVQLDINGDDDFTLSYSLNQQQRRGIRQLLNELTFMIATGSGLRARLDVPEIAELDLGRVEITTNGVPWARWMERTLHALFSLIRSGEGPDVSFDDIGLRGSEAERFVGALTGGSIKIELELAAEPDLAQTMRNLVYFVRFEAGDAVFEAIVRRPCLHVDVTGRRMTARFGQPVVLDRRADARRGDGPLQPLRVRFAKVVAGLGRGVLTLDDGDFMGPYQGNVELLT